ncbi:hypothetical protein E4T43_06699 [Aureobasidium subglaciale]|nr:hypothetical protein E4T43_06699 [Aureobasidium subglaciale]
MDNLLEAYDIYGPHKGLFVPRLEPSDDPKVAFEIHWDRICDAIQEPGTASTPVLVQPSESEATLDSILEEHHQRRNKDNTTAPTDEKRLPFAETECNAVPEAIPPTPDLTPKEMSDRVTAEYNRRKDLSDREELGEVTSKSSLAGIKGTFYELESYITQTQSVPKAYRERQVHGTTESVDVSHTQVLTVLTSPRYLKSLLGTARQEAVNYGIWPVHCWLITTILESATRLCDRIALLTSAEATTESVQPIMRPADVDEAAPVRPSPPTPGQLTPEQVYAHAKAELERLVDLVKRERIGLLEIPASGTASSLVDIEQVLDDLEK